jgi:hypothetical protein
VIYYRAETRGERVQGAAGKITRERLWAGKLREKQITRISSQRVGGCWREHKATRAEAREGDMDGWTRRTEIEIPRRHQRSRSSEEREENSKEE